MAWARPTAHVQNTYVYSQQNKKWNLYESYVANSSDRDLDRMGHNDLEDLINESLYRYLQMHKQTEHARELSNGFYILADGLSMYFDFEQRIREMSLAGVFNQNSLKYPNVRKNISYSPKGIDAVAMEDLALHGDTLQISYVWRHIKLQRNKTLSVETDADSKRTFYYKYSPITEKWEPMKED